MISKVVEVLAFALFCGTLALATCMLGVTLVDLFHEACYLLRRLRPIHGGVAGFRPNPTTPKEPDA